MERSPGNPQLGDFGPADAPPASDAPPSPPRRRTVHRKITSGSSAKAAGPRIASSRAAQLFQPPPAAQNSRRKHFVEEELQYPDRDHALAHGYGLPVGASMRKGISNPTLYDSLDGEELPPAAPIMRRKSRPSLSFADRDGWRTGTGTAGEPSDRDLPRMVRKSSISLGELAASDDMARGFSSLGRTPSGSLPAWSNSLSRGKSLRETSDYAYATEAKPNRPRKPSSPDEPGTPILESTGIAPSAGIPSPRRRQPSGSSLNWKGKAHMRRASHDEKFVSRPRSFYVDVEDTRARLLRQEDLDGDYQITVTDKGPKVFPLRTAASGGYKKHEVRGTYMLSNLLQELALASDYGRKYIVIAEDRLAENPVERLHRMIKYHFWDELTRRIDADGLELITEDPKNRSADQHRRIYVPYRDQFAQQYYQRVARERPKLGLEIEVLPETITPRFVKSLDQKPGILSLALKTQIDPKTGQVVTRGVPFVVPGGRFNEMYGWDSYFETLGLLVDGRIELGKAMVDNFLYMIEHYNKILNANRSYYLTRSQPPFLTDMILEVRKKLVDKPAYTRPELKRWTARGFRACIKELLGVWLSDPRLDRTTGLCTYHTEGIGMPPETESSHFDHIMEPFARRHGVDVETFKKMYADEEVDEPDLDDYFVHDRAVRESGHDTTYRFERKCASLATIDLNSLLYKYSMDIATVIREEFKDCFRFRVRRGENDCNFEAFMRFRQHLVDAKGSIEQALGDDAEWDSSWAKEIAVLDDLTDQWILELENLKMERERREEERMEQQRHANGVPDNEDGVNGANGETSSPKSTSPAESKTVETPANERPQFPIDLATEVSSSPMYWNAEIEHPDSPYFVVTASSTLFQLISRRIRQQVNKYCWNPKEGIFYDYNIHEQLIDVYETVTTTWALWAGLATPEQAQRIVSETRQRFEVIGGLVSGTEESRGKVGLDRPNRQWDFPMGWAPHQMLAWVGCAKYGMVDIAERFAYRWLYTITKSFVDFNGVIPEKFDVVNLSHKIDMEYGSGCPVSASARILFNPTIIFRRWNGLQVHRSGGIWLDERIVCRGPPVPAASLETCACHRHPSRYPLLPHGKEDSRKSCKGSGRKTGSRRREQP